MAGFDGAEITISGWAKFNDRKDVKRPSWFRLEHDLISDPEFYGLTDGEFRAWIYLLSQASRKNKGGKFTLFYAHAEGSSRVSASALDGAIEKLSKLKILTANVTDASRARTASDTHMPSTYVRTYETDVTRRDETNELLAAGSAPGTPRGSKTADVWSGYRGAYEGRYGESPVRNRTVNALLARFVDRIGAGEAAAVAAFYVAHNDSFYVKAMHPVNLMLRDAEKLRTEWATGTRMLGSKAKEIERAQHNFDAWDRAAAIVEKAKVEP